MTMLPNEILFPLKTQSVNSTAASTTNNVDFSDNCVAVEIYATQAAHFRFGPTTTLAVSVTNSGIDGFVELGGKRGPYSIGSHKRIGVVRDSADGVVRITELVRVKPAI